MSIDVDVSGVENAACALIKQAKKDFIRGAKVLYFHIGDIPSQEELLKSDSKKRSLMNNEAVRWMYDSWRFVRDDPYELFSPGEDTVIDAWKTEAILDHYRALYLTAATILYKKKAKKDIQNIVDGALDIYFEDQINGKMMIENFIKARNYIRQRFDAKEIFRKWNVEAYARSHKVRLNGKKAAIQDSEYFKKNVARRLENIKKAKELEAEGKTIDQIALTLGVTKSAVWSYLRS